ncbi:nitrogen fixation protein NifQ [Propionivibrio sp.]|uniref:nitrogen fixation protein NifQ n=1 Tax=Propionivibrio sp. TaxID=2212460 RepID=UPI003BF26B7E
MNGPDRLPYRCFLLAELLVTPASTAAVTDPNRLLFASMIAGQCAGEGCLPAHLGLGADRYAQLLSSYYAGDLPRATERKSLDIPEFEDLQKLLLDHRANERDSECWMADIVATACAGSDHLWQDLGLVSRNELTRLMWVNFPELARANTGDMKWKKFLYRRFCSSEGIYVCPAPSCCKCKDYAKCFGPEN